jgi:lipopolysaccharide transport system ATP-binding protein
MPDIAIRVQNLGKLYRIGEAGHGAFRYKSLRDVLSNPFRRRSSPNSETIWALKDVSFEVKPGEVVGIIGRNGAGKSTLLKILSRITEPTEGFVEIRGRVGSLLEVGTGFHPELTGRENIYLNGAILGMKKAEIAKKFDEIVAFAEVEKFIDTPVKHYSSGMYVRLAFAVAAHLEPEILLVDEVLAVGDAAFQKKCLGKMGDVAKQGRTVLFVSHNMRAIEALCSRAALLDCGRIVIDDRPSEVVICYTAKLRETVDASQAEIAFPLDPSKSTQIKRLRVLNDAGKATLQHDVLSPIEIQMEFVLCNDLPTLIMFVSLWAGDNTGVLHTMDSDWENFTGQNYRDQFPRKRGSYLASLKIPAPLLNKGVYEIEAVLTTGPTRLDTRRGIYFEVKDNGSFLTCVTKSERGGLLSVPIRWHVQQVGLVAN